MRHARIETTSERSSSSPLAAGLRFMSSGGEMRASGPFGTVFGRIAGLRGRSEADQLNAIGHARSVILRNLTDLARQIPANRQEELARRASVEALKIQLGALNQIHELLLEQRVQRAQSLDCDLPVGLL